MKTWCGLWLAYAHCMQLCAITDRRRLANSTRLGGFIEEWAAGGVDFIQLREKDLDGPELQSLAHEIAAGVGGAKLLVNIPSPEWAGLALTAGAQGVHLAGPPTPGAAGAVRRGLCGRDHQRPLS